MINNQEAFNNLCYKRIFGTQNLTIHGKYTITNGKQIKKQKEYAKPLNLIKKSTSSAFYKHSNHIFLNTKKKSSRLLNTTDFGKRKLSKTFYHKEKMKSRE